MTPDPTLLAPPSNRPTSERPSAREALLQALQERDAVGVVVLSQRWVHRHSVESLEGLIGELSTGDAGLRHWWAALVGRSGAPELASQPPASQPTELRQPSSLLGGEIALEPEPTEPGSGGMLDTLPQFEPLPALGGLSDIDVNLDALARDTFLLAAPPANPEPPVIPPLARFQPTPDAPAAAAPEPEKEPELELEPERELELRAEPEPPGDDPTPHSRPLARLTSLVRDCLEEVARTFQGSDGPGIPAAEVPPPAAAHQPPVGIAPPAAANTAATTTITADPVVEAPLVIATGRSGPAPRPAPAPSHPALASLRSWLPDAPEPQQRRAS